MKKNTLIIILLISFLIITNEKNPKTSKGKKQKSTHKKEDEPNTEESIISNVLEWAKKNNIYINTKISLNRRTKRDNYYYFSADSKIPNNTLLLKMPYDILITQKNFYDIYQNTKNKKFENLWQKILEMKSEYVKYYSTQQLLYMSIILEYATRKKKGPIYKKYKEYLKLDEKRNMDIYPMFYDQEEKYYLGGSNFGSQLNRATEALNEEYILLSTKLNVSIPNQDDFFRTRVISLISSADFNNSNIDLPSGYNETCIVPFLDCFNKVISADRANAFLDFKGIYNEEKNYTDYYLEIYSSDEIYIGSELNLKWRPFPNTEFLLYYGQIEEGNPFNSKYYVDIINRKLKEKLGFDKDKVFKNLKRDLYEIRSEFYDPSVINAYRNLSLEIDKYKNKEEGAYELMRDNLQDYLDMYDVPLSDGNINIYISGNDKKRDIKEIMHQERKLIESKVEHLDKVINGIKSRNIIVDDKNKEDDIEENKNEEIKDKDENKPDNNNSKDNKGNEEL